jgi:hypothetical protein
MARWRLLKPHYLIVQTDRAPAPRHGRGERSRRPAVLTPMTTKKGEIRPLNPRITPERVVDLLSRILSPQQIHIFIKGTTQDKIDLRPILEACRAFDVLSSILPPQQIRKRLEAMQLLAETQRGLLKRRPPGRPRRRRSQQKYCVPMCIGRAWKTLTSV